MAETTFGISSFIRVAGQSRGQAVSSLRSRKYRRSDGFNPYLNLNRQIKSFALGLVETNQALVELSNSGNDYFKNMNPRNFQRVVNWISTSGFQALPISEVRYYTGPLDRIRIKSEPILFGYYKGQLYCVEIWHTESPILSRWMTSLGIGLMEEAFRSEGDRFGHFAILDQRQNQLHSRLNRRLPELDVQKVVQDHEHIWTDISRSSDNRIIIDANRNREFGFGEIHPY